MYLLMHYIDATCYLLLIYTVIDIFLKLILVE